MRRSSLLVLFAVIAAAPLAAQADAAAPVAIEQRLAQAAHLQVGDTLRLSSTATPLHPLARVAAIFSPRADPTTIMRRDYHIRMHLPDLAALLGQPDRVDRIGVVLQPGIDPDSAAADLNRTAFGYDLFPTKVIATQSSVTFLVVSRFHHAIAFISILASTIFLLCLMLLKVEERRRDVAVLRFTGISRQTIFRALVLEATVIAVAGSATGVMLAAVASSVVNAYYQRAFATSLIFSEFSATTVLLAVLLSVLLGIVAGTLAAWRMVRTAPLELWRRAA
jgi:putative ABC transport system permease protein